LSPNFKYFRSIKIKKKRGGRNNRITKTKSPHHSKVKLSPLRDTRSGSREKGYSGVQSQYMHTLKRNTENKFLRKSLQPRSLSKEKFNF